MAKVKAASTLTPAWSLEQCILCGGEGSGLVSVAADRVVDNLI